MPRLPIPSVCNRLARGGRQGLVLHGGLEAGAQAAAGIQLGGAGRAGFQVAQHFLVGFHEQLVTDIGVHVTAGFLAGAFSKLNPIHALFPPWLSRPIPYACAASSSFSRRIPRPRLKRDITVPTGML